MDRDSNSTSPWEYMNFELKIRKGAPCKYAVAVCSPTGEARVLPRELLDDLRPDEYLCFSSRRIPLVRYPELSQPVERLPVIPPLGILRMVFGLPGLGQPDVEREKRCKEETLGVMAVRQ